MKKQLATALILSAGLLSSSVALANDAVIGALIGGGAGVLVGRSVGGRDGAVVGAALGAAAGAAIASENDRPHYRHQAGYYAPPPPAPVYYSEPAYYPPQRVYYRQPVRIPPPPVYYIESGHGYRHGHGRHGYR